MKKLWSYIWNGEPVVVWQIPTVLLATASGIWSNEYLAFAAAGTAAVGAILARMNVSPTATPFSK